MLQKYILEEYDWISPGVGIDSTNLNLSFIYCFSNSSPPLIRHCRVIDLWSCFLLQIDHNILLVLHKCKLTSPFRRLLDHVQWLELVLGYTNFFVFSANPIRFQMLYFTAFCLFYNSDKIPMTGTLFVYCRRWMLTITLYTTSYFSATKLRSWENLTGSFVSLCRISCS